jgi:hypothetical protein
MINIFDYTDFRKYLTDFYEDRKKTIPVFHIGSLQLWEVSMPAISLRCSKVNETSHLPLPKSSHKH